MVRLPEAVVTRTDGAPLTMDTPSVSSRPDTERRMASHCAPGISRLMPPATEPPLKVENISAKESIAPRLTEDSEMFRNARRSRQSIPVVVNRLQS